VPTNWIALNVYHWGARPQARLLAGGLLPLLRELAREGAVRSAWCARFDARGPHVFLLVGAAPGAAPAVSERLAAGVARYLALHPSGETLSAETLGALHEGCRGKCLAPADRLPGLARNNTFEIGAQEPGGYPLRLTEGMDPAGAAAFWRAATLLFRWAVERAGRGEGTAGALALVPAVDAALRRAGEDVSRVWAHQAAMLVPALRALAEDDPEQARAAAARGVSPRNRALFDRAWEEGGDGAPAAVVAGLVRRCGGRLPPLREALHCVLGVLGLPAVVQLPLVLHAWERALPAPAAAGRE
jgi:hypothetical protein